MIAASLRNRIKVKMEEENARIEAELEEVRVK